MKRFLILFLLCITTIFGAYGKPPVSITINKDVGETVKKQVTDTVKYTFLSGNNDACYVNKAFVSTKPSIYWFCGKKSAKCNGNAWSSLDTVKELTGDKEFSHDGTKYRCCNDDASVAGTFKKYQAPTEAQEKYSVSGGWCYQTVSVDMCGKKTITKPCKEPTECPSDKVLHNKKCLDDCPSGKHFESGTSDTCVADKLNCSDTQVEHNGKCVEKCTGGKDFESAASNKCVCGSGKVEINGVCETKKTCASDENYIELTNTCISKGKPDLGSASEVSEPDIPNPKETPAEVTYEFLFNDAKSCYVKKPSDKSDTELFWCGKKTSNKCGDYKESDASTWSEIYEVAGGTADNYCCCGGTDAKTGVFQKCTTPGTRTKIKKIGGGLCQYTVKVDSCNRETIEKDCNTPDSTLSVSGKIPVTKSNMQECGLCSVKDDFKTCILNSCYEKDTKESACTSKLKEACLIKK